MKKALIALAVLGAASGAAMAQSSVTLYGVADIAIGKAQSAGDTKWGAQTNTIVTNGTSRIGLTGKEDLGGGMWAGFRFESPVNLANGNTTGANVTGDGLGWNREANVSLGSNSWGTVKLGRSTTPGYDGQGVYELTQWANYSVVANTFGWGGYFAPRNNAQIEYISPSIYGLSIAIAYIPKAEGAIVSAAGNGTNNSSDMWAGNIVYNQGPLKIALTGNKTSHVANMTSSARNHANSANWSLGGSYNFFNTFALSVSYNRANNAQEWRLRRLDGCNNVYVCANPNLNSYGGNLITGARRYGWELGGSYFVGPFTITLDLTRDTTNTLYANNKKYTNGVLEGKYALSKRTFLYADYLRLDNDNNYGIGIRHNF